MNLNPQVILRGVDPNMSGAPLDTPLDCLRRILPEVDLRDRRDGAFQFANRLTLVSAWTPGGFRRHRNSEATLLALEKLFSLLEFSAPPTISAVDLLKSCHSPRRRVCAGRYFALIVIPGRGDLIVEFRSRVLLERTNRLIVEHWNDLAGANPSVEANA